MEMTTLGPMLMYGKEASNRKQEIDLQFHTIPNQRSQRPKDKHRGNVYNLLFRYGKVSFTEHGKAKELIIQKDGNTLGGFSAPPD